MRTLHLVDPELPEIVAQLPPLAPTNETLPQLREAVIGLYPPSEVSVEERIVPGPTGAPDVRVSVHRPKDADGPLPARTAARSTRFSMASLARS